MNPTAPTTTTLDPAGMPAGSSADELLDRFLTHLTTTGTTPYPHQEEAILEIYQDRNVILETPTGSGKSLVALAMQWKSLCQGRRSYYTVPIKALANEKFLALCQAFGPVNVGLITGDATVNPGAPVICCTAEILANLAMRDGAAAAVDDVIIDEFHYYGDRDRGSAWQIPLLCLPRARFLLMSATLGDSNFFARELTRLTGAPTIQVRSADRPVPLEFSYSTTQLQELVAELVDAGRAPIYLVHFTQQACAETARNLLSTNFCSREEKAAIQQALLNADFRSPYGRELAKTLRHGVGIHHAGLLPKYRLLVERLTARGLLKVICGTDTLGVGVNVPIRTVLLTALCKYDGSGTRILSARDFHQICGRAGRRGFDTRGFVVAQAPEHVIENLKLEAKAAANPKKAKFVRKKPPERGYVHWDESTFQRLLTSPPEPLASSFTVTSAMLLNVLGRDHEDGCGALRALIDRCHEPPPRKRALRRQAWQLFRGLLRARIFHIIPPAERRTPRKLALDVALPDDFSMNQPLCLWLLETLPQLDAAAPEYPLNVVSLIEAILENPDGILRKQVDLLKAELMARLKEEGVEFDARIARLEEVEWPMPGRDFIYTTFNEFLARHPYLAGQSVRPKSIAREMLENYQSFEDYIKTYKLERSEALLLRHLTEVYKVLAQTVPANAKTPELLEAEAFLELIVRHTDSSLLDEWETLRDPNHPSRRSNNSQQAGSEPAAPAAPPAFGSDRPALLRQLRSHIHTLLTALARGDYDSALTLIEPSDSAGRPWSPERLAATLDPFLRERDRIRLDPEARNARHTHLPALTTTLPDHLRVEQILVDPHDLNDWSLLLTLDLPKSRSARTTILTLEHAGPCGS